MIPNKTDEQILYQQFKYFDLDSTGYCSLQNFVRVHNRLGVVLPKVKDFEIIFNYFSDPESSLLNYKKFCNEIFNLNPSNRVPPEYDSANDEKDFVCILIDKLLSKDGAFTLLELIKNLQMIDFEGNKRLNSDEFLTALQRCGIKLETNEIQTLFLGYDFFINGVIKYQLLVDILLMQFWDEKKNSLGEDIFFNLTNGGRKQMTLNDMKNYFNDILEDSPDKTNLLNFIDKYKVINKNRTDQNITLPDMIKFLRFYGFGQNSYAFLENMISVLEPDIPKEKRNYNFDNLKNKYEPKKEIGNKKNELSYIFEKIREKIFNYSRKTFFNFLKHFKYYDNNSSDISKYNFAKVLKDFNLNLSVDDIETLFAYYGNVRDNKSINYKDFINDLISEFTDKKREKVIKYIYGTILERGAKFNRDIDLSFLKDVYNPKKNYFKKEEGENRLEFEDCLELFHYVFKGNKTEIFDKNNFLEFYKCMSFLVYSDNDFMKLMSNEWRVPYDYVQNEILGKNQDDNDIYNNNYDYDLPNNKRNDIEIKDNNLNKNDDDENYNKDYPKKPKLIERLINNDFDNKENANNEENIQRALSLLNNILKKRGLRGLLYLHLEFINSCPDLSKITIEDFINIFEIQHINLPDIDYQNIFNQFTSKNNNKYLDFSSFIRNFKKELNDNKLSSVEQAFTNIDVNENEKVPLNIIKKKFRGDRHPDMLSGRKTEEEIILEFLDCFNINYEILNLDSKQNSNYVDFEIFANFYEYVSFIYPDDKEFANIVRASWS